MKPSAWVATPDCPRVPDPTFDSGTRKPLQIRADLGCPTVPDSNSVIHMERVKEGVGPTEWPRETYGLESGTVGQLCKLPENQQVNLYPDYLTVPGYSGTEGQKTLASQFVEVLATWSGLPAEWWADDGFCLQAAALGYAGPPPQPPPTGDGGLAEWERIAGVILARDFQTEPADRTTIESWEIGLRGFPGSTICQDALGKLSVINPVKWGKRDVRAGRLLPR